MERASRRPQLGLIAVVVGLPVLILGPWAHAAASAPEVPTISFFATGTAPVMCGTRPDVTNLVIQRGTRVIIANRTGVRATVDIGRRAVLELADGDGALVRLRRGQHAVQVIPQCAVLLETEKAVVQVLTAAEMSDLLTPTPVTEGARTQSDEPRSNDGASTSSADDTTPTEPGVVSGSGANAEAAVASVEAAAVTDPPVLEVPPEPADDAVIEVDAIRLGETTDAKGLGLVAAIATICVFGVTAAIIRAIVSERTTRSVR